MLGVSQAWRKSLPQVVVLLANDLTAEASPMIAKSGRCCVPAVVEENARRFVNGCRSRGIPATQLGVTACKDLTPAPPAQNKLHDACSPRKRLEVMPQAISAAVLDGQAPGQTDIVDSSHSIWPLLTMPQG